MPNPPKKAFPFPRQGTLTYPASRKNVDWQSPPQESANGVSEEKGWALLPAPLVYVRVLPPCLLSALDCALLRSATKRAVGGEINRRSQYTQERGLACLHGRI